MRKKAREVIAREDTFDFTKRGPQWVESSHGFETGFSGRFELEYREGDHVLRVPVDPVSEGVVVELSRAERWEPPHASETVTDEKRAVIRENIAGALRYLRVGHSFA